VRERVCECVRGEEREKERVRVCVYVCVCVCKLIMTPQPCGLVEILKGSLIVIFFLKSQLYSGCSGYI